MFSKSWFKTDKSIIIALSLLLVLFTILFMTYDAKGSWSFVLNFRGRKIMALALIAIAIGTSTVLFHSITHNRIITPAIMGFDALYVFIQTTILFVFGATDFINLDTVGKFLFNMGVMTVVFLLLFQWLFLKANRSIFLLALTGIILGIFFRSLNDFMFRLLDPNTFAVLQGVLFSSFNAIESKLLNIAAIVIACCLIPTFLLRHKLDIVALGREKAIALGVNYKPTVFGVLAIIAVLVSVSTALVGPITFFGLLVANMAYLLVRNQNHTNLLIVTCLIAICTLVGGQFIFEKLINLKGTLSIVIECLGGITFIWMLLKAHKK